MSNKILIFLLHFTILICVYHCNWQSIASLLSQYSNKLLSSSSFPGFPFANRNTDAAMRFRIITGAANVPPNQAITTIQFGSEYRTHPATLPALDFPLSLWSSLTLRCNGSMPTTLRPARSR